MSGYLKYPPGIILLEDALQLNGKHIVQYILKDNTDNIELLCFEKSPEKWKTVLGSSTKCISQLDPRQWSTFLLTYLRTLSRSSTIVIDSANQMSAILGWEHTLDILNNLKNHANVKYVVVLLHGDCLLYGKAMVKQLVHLTSTHIVIDAIISATRYHLSSKLQMPTGKIVQFLEDVYLDTDKKWINKEIPRDLIKTSNDSTTINPTNITSFKIAIEGPAKAIKDDMILPYTELNQGGGKVIYEHDAGDDWDDEDPDDDLDI